MVNAQFLLHYHKCQWDFKCFPTAKTEQFHSALNALSRANTELKMLVGIEFQIAITP